MVSLESATTFTECNPFKDNEELLKFATEPYSWIDFVQPLEKQCDPRWLGDQFTNVSSSDRQLHMKQCDEKDRLKVLVCHDMAGNYRDDRFINGTQKYDDYRFYHWAGIDFFNYFSHYYVTVPPVTWTNAAHRHGVIMLGTFIVEEAHLLEEVLSSDTSVERTIDALLVATKNLGFDGWLLNIECVVAADKIPTLKYFVRTLSQRIHEEIAHGTVIWYDSVIEDGSLKWQNEVNEKNVQLYEGTDGILLNYCWTDESLVQTAKQLNNNPAAMANVFVGIDVFSRSQNAGFNSVELVRNIKKSNFSVGLFAPGWTFETMDGINPFATTPSDVCNTTFLERENRFWSLLWGHFFLRGPMALPFYTSFCLGSGRRRFKHGACISAEPWFNLSRQQYQPCIPSAFEHEFDDAFHGGSCLKLTRNLSNQRLLVSNFACDKNVIVALALKRSTPEIGFQLILSLSRGAEQSNRLIHCSVDSRPCTLAETDAIHHMEQLDQKSVDEIVKGLADRSEKPLRLAAEELNNGWQICYFRVQMDGLVKGARIVDVAVSIGKTDGKWEKNDVALLGALQFHAGL